jgi:hypothetical protein
LFLRAEASEPETESADGLAPAQERESQPCELFLSAEVWSRGRDLNPRPADSSTDTMLLDSRALFFTIQLVFGGYLAGSVQKLLTGYLCDDP